MQPTHATAQAASPSERDANPPDWRAPLGLAALIFVVYFFISTGSSIWDRDEARFSRATAEMVSTGNYLYPTFNGKLRPDKPILIYWLMSVPVRLFGHTEWAYRLCSVIGTTLTCLFTYWIGRKLFNHRTGLWAMALLAANPMMVYEGAVATSDAVLLAFITGCLAVFADALADRLRAKHLVALIVLFSCGMLTKGPVSLLAAIPVILTHVLLRRELGNPKAAILKIAGCALVACIVFLVWFFPANAATNYTGPKWYHHDLFNQMVLHHAVERMGKPLEGHGGYSFFYLIFYGLVVLGGFFPWTLYLPGSLMRLCGGEKDDGNEHGVFKWFVMNAKFAFRAIVGVWSKLGRGEGEQRRGRMLLLTWIATFVITMTAISTKLPHYILPIWPALALCVGAYLDATTAEDAPSSGALWTVLGGTFFLVMALGLTAGLGFGPEYLSGKFAEWLKAPAGWAGLSLKSRLFQPKNIDVGWLAYANDSRAARATACALILIVTLPLIFRHRVAHFSANAKVLLGAALLALLMMGTLLMPGFERVKISRSLAAQIQTHVADDTPVTVCDYKEASLVFYLNRNVEDIVPDRSGYAGAKNSGDAKKEPSFDSQAPPKVVEQGIIEWANKRGRGVLIIPRKRYDDLKASGRVPELDVVGEIKNGFNYSKGFWIDVIALRRNE